MTIRWFVRRPYAVNQFGKRAGFPEDTDPEILEHELRACLPTTTKTMEACISSPVREGEYALRATTKHNTVYVIIKRAADGKDYDYISSAVLTEEGLNEGKVDGRLGRVTQSLPLKRKRERTNINNGPSKKDTLYLRYITPTDEVLHFREFTAEDIPDEVIRLLEEGVALASIKVLQEVPINIQAVLDM